MLRSRRPETDTFDLSCAASCCANSFSHSAETMAITPIRVEPHEPVAPARSFVFDLLRAAAICSILLAHSGPPAFVAQLRNFDVVLVVLIGGAVCALANERRPIEPVAYMKKRALRLLAPTYVFLAGYFVLMEIVAPARFDAEIMLRTFLLADGIGYVWILRIFLIVALLAPWLLRLRDRVSPRAYFALLFCAYVADEAVYAMFERLPVTRASEWVEFTLFYAVPYGAIFGLGLRWPRMSQTEAARWAVAAFAVWLAMLAVIDSLHASVRTWDYKYPPRAIYVWYGLAAGHAVYAMFLGADLGRGRAARVVEFVSAQSLWIYLWHIPSLQVGRELAQRLDLPAPWVTKWLVTTSLSLSLTWTQTRLVAWYRRTRQPTGMKRWFLDNVLQC